jgi:phosphoesterase RecJ-like protein
MQDQTLQAIAELLKSRDHIVILPHVNIDGDALGASLALGLALKSLGKSVDILTEEEVPNTLAFLPGLDLVNHPSREVYEVAVNMDNGDINRLNSRLKYFQNAEVKLSIDHHATNKVEADHSYVNTSASATGEIIYDLMLNYLGVSLTRETAIALYTAIITDTGGMRYSNTTPRTLEITADLMRQEIDFPLVIRKVFDQISHAKLYLMKQTMNSLRLLCNGLLAVSGLSFADITRYNARTDDFEGLVNIGRNLEGVEVSLFIREDAPGSFKGSLRSNHHVNVARIAEQFGGGGHQRAAGFSMTGDIESVTKAVIDEITKHIPGAV